MKLALLKKPSNLNTTTKTRIRNASVCTGETSSREKRSRTKRKLNRSKKKRGLPDLRYTTRDKTASSSRTIR